jgi:hypothetical protein
MGAKITLWIELSDEWVFEDDLMVALLRCQIVLSRLQPSIRQSIKLFAIRMSAYIL